MRASLHRQLGCNYKGLDRRVEGLILIDSTLLMIVLGRLPSQLVHPYLVLLVNLLVGIIAFVVV